MPIDDENLDDEQILCATYTHARRHPMVLGRIAGWNPPFQLSLTQLGVVIAILFIEVRTYKWWGALLPRMIGVLVMVIVPCVVAWAIRSTRIEGRSLPRAAFAYLSMLWMPKDGHVGGRPTRLARPAQPWITPMYVERGEDDRRFYAAQERR